MDADDRFAQMALALGHDFGGGLRIGGHYQPVLRLASSCG